MLNVKRKQSLKAKAHLLKPVVLIGDKGLTENVLKEIQVNLKSHELIKIKLKVEKEKKVEISNLICEKLQSELVNIIGNVVILYKKNPEKNKNI